MSENDSKESDNTFMMKKRKIILSDFSGFLVVFLKYIPSISNKSFEYVKFIYTLKVTGVVIW